MDKGIWLQLSGSLFYFGSGGVTRVEEHTGYVETTQKKSDHKSKLMAGTTSITLVNETPAEIYALLAGWNK